MGPAVRAPPHRGAGSPGRCDWGAAPRRPAGSPRPPSERSPCVSPGLAARPPGTRGKSSLAPAVPTATSRVPGTCDSAAREAASFLCFRFPFSQGRDSHLPRPSMALPKDSCVPRPGLEGAWHPGQRGVSGLSVLLVYMSPVPGGEGTEGRRLASESGGRGPTATEQPALSMGSGRSASPHHPQVTPA